MRRHEAELLAHQIMDRLERGQPIEDDALVELKADWPNDEAAARRIAAHANSAQGDEIVWLIGVDEKSRSVRGASHIDPATWYGRVQSYFVDSWAPSLKVVNVPRNGVTVVALILDTAGAPFLVKAPGGRFEVPWRGSTQTRSARRAELLKMLSPRVRLPNIEVDTGRLIHHAQPNHAEDWLFSLELNVYVTPQDERTIVLPYHRMKAALFTSEGQEVFEFEDFSANSEAGSLEGSYPRFRAPHIEATPSEVIITGPGRMTLIAKCSAEAIDIEGIESACEVRFQVRPAIGDVRTTIRQNFVRGSKESWIAIFVGGFPLPSGL